MIRDQILDWLALQRHSYAWWNEPHGALRRKAGRLKFMTPNNRHYKTGVPDILGFWRGRPLAIEVKRPPASEMVRGKKTRVAPGVASEDQVTFMQDARPHGCVCFFAWTLMDARLSLQEFDQSMGLTWET